MPISVVTFCNPIQTRQAIARMIRPQTKPKYRSTRGDGRKDRVLIRRQRIQRGRGGMPADVVILLDHDPGAVAQHLGGPGLRAHVR